MSRNAREAILAAARQMAQAHGYGGLNFRDLASAVGIKAASIYYHFENKADLGAAVAQRYWEDTAAELDELLEQSPDPRAALVRYPWIFRRSLENENRLCLGSFMSAEYDDLPDTVKTQVQAFADVNVAWLGKVLTEAGLGDAASREDRARAIFAAIAGAQLLARSRADIGLFDTLVESYRTTGLLP
ncbi:TetR/AcrR family transcriptional regulator [Oceanicella sp. SM1341]|uniref:TetR/AcrR family transcriptional regulator n=1 Tax=Oceanicella sp. SM1341 TaxID=1548889 RepID=UPI000E51B91B|nr:TetR/AcrR family transcriptional regulator [Oceanicella sp. SM1341]